MDFREIKAGDNVPDAVNVVIEIPARGLPVKYEVDKESGVLFVDRFLGTSMQYPTNYGYVPQTLSDDGDPVDVLVVTPVPLTYASVISARPIGMLKMSDEAGEDAKILAVPVDKLSGLYKDIKSPQDLSPHMLAAITHFFEHYKDLEEGKWVKVEGWVDAEAAKKEILASLERYKNPEAVT